MPRFDKLHRRLEQRWIQVLIWLSSIVVFVGVAVAGIACAADGDATSKILFGVGLLIAFSLFSVWIVYTARVRPVIRAERILAVLAKNLNLRALDRYQCETTPIREHPHPDGRERFLEGDWAGFLVAIVFDPPLHGSENSSECGETRVYLTTSYPLAKMAQVARWHTGQVFFDKLLAFMGQARPLKRISEDFGAYGDDAEIARCFSAGVLDLIRAFPRKVSGPIVEGCTVRMQWEDLEFDTTVITKAFGLLQTIAESAVRE